MGFDMNEHELRGLIGKVKIGKLSRRGFVQRMMAVGIAAPFATQLLVHSGVAMAQAKDTYAPTKRGGGGILRGRTSSRLVLVFSTTRIGPFRESEPWTSQ